MASKLETLEEKPDKTVSSEPDSFKEEEKEIGAWAHTKVWVPTGAVLTVLWVLIRGITPGHILQELIIGAGVSFPIAYGLRGMYSGSTDLRHWISSTPEILQYTGNYSKELVLSSIDVAKIVITPNMLIEPDIIEVPLRLENPDAVTVLANSITLTPGTLTMDYSEGKNALYVHGITGRSNREEILETIQHWEDLLIKIFDEDIDGVEQNE